MYNSFELIHSKHTFKLQKYLHAILVQSEGSENSVLNDIGNCGVKLTSEMLAFHEQDQLVSQIESLERFTIYVAKIMALLPHIPKDMSLFPTVDEMSNWSHHFYYVLLQEHARKKEQYRNLRKLN